MALDIYICQKNGLKIIEVPVNWEEIGGSKVKIIKDSMRMFIDILRIRVNSLCNFYQLHR